MKCRRSSIPKKIETEVLSKSRRRCSLCFFLDGDVSVKKVQIAHLDKNPNNNKADNLVVLCLDHHDEFDSISSQSKGMTLHEVKHYRDKLYKIIEDRDNNTLLKVFNAHRNIPEEPQVRLVEGKAVEIWDGFLTRVREIPMPEPYAIAVADVINLIKLPDISEMFGIPYDDALHRFLTNIKNVLNKIVSSHSMVYFGGLCNDNAIIVSSSADILLSCIIDLFKTAKDMFHSADEYLQHIGFFRVGITWTDSSKSQSYNKVRSGILALKISDKAGRKPNSICITEAMYEHLSKKNRADFSISGETSDQGNLYIRTEEGLD